ncbi:MAG: hypothetical protein AAGG45_05365 [Pseudomonadota bacterium]
MFKLIMMIAIMSGFTAAASADVLPKPPSAKYIPAESQSCEPIKMSLYFQNGEAILSSYARRVIDDARSQLEGCQIIDVDMVAQVSDARNPIEETVIGQDRLAIVASVLRDQGLLHDDPASARIESAPTEQRLPMTRRVDVTVSARDRTVS